MNMYLHALDFKRQRINLASSLMERRPPQVSLLPPSRTAGYRTFQALLLVGSQAPLATVASKGSWQAPLQQDGKHFRREAVPSLAGQLACLPTEGAYVRTLGQAVREPTSQPGTGRAAYCSARYSPLACKKACSFCEVPHTGHQCTLPAACAMR